MLSVFLLKMLNDILVLMCYNLRIGTYTQILHWNWNIIKKTKTDIVLEFKFDNRSIHPKVLVGTKANNTKLVFLNESLLYTLTHIGQRKEAIKQIKRWHYIKIIISYKFKSQRIEKIL